MGSDAPTAKVTEPSTQPSEPKDQWQAQLVIGGKVISDYEDDLATMRKKLKEHLEKNVPREDEEPPVKGSAKK